MVTWVNTLVFIKLLYFSALGGFPGGSVVKNSPAMQEMRVWPLGWEGPLEKEMATHSTTLAWEIVEQRSGYSPWVTRVIRDLATKPLPLPPWPLEHAFIQRSAGRCHKMTDFVYLNTVERNSSPLTHRTLCLYLRSSFLWEWYEFLHWILVSRYIFAFSFKIFSSLHKNPQDANISFHVINLTWLHFKRKHNDPQVRSKYQIVTIASIH